EKFLLEAGLTRASFIKITEDDSENTWDLGSKAAGKDKVEKRRASGFSRRIAQIFASVPSVIALIALAGYPLGWDAGVASGNGWLAGMGAILPHLGGQGSFATRMAPSAAFAFLLNGVALTTLDFETRRGARPAQHLALIALLLSLIVALGHAY